MSFELNKIFGAILGTLLFIMGVGFLAEAIYEPGESKGVGYVLPVDTAAAPGEGTDAGPAATPIGVLLASADPVAGQNSAKKCLACHDFTEGGPNKTGPNLYGVVGRPIGSHPGFAYSAVLEEHHANGDVWSYDNLNHFITAPKSFAPGTKMTFAGIKDDAERANVIAYLSTLSATPVPFPAADAAPAAEPAASSEAPAAPASSEAPAAPMSSEETPAASSEAPAASSEAPAVSSEAPAASSEAPMSTESSSAAQ